LPKRQTVVRLNPDCMAISARVSPWAFQGGDGGGGTIQRIRHARNMPCGVAKEKGPAVNCRRTLLVRVPGPENGRGTGFLKRFC
jgi:hypothetical protein